MSNIISNYYSTLASPSLIHQNKNLLTLISAGIRTLKSTEAKDGTRPHEDGEEILPPGDREVLLAHDARFPHEQEDPRGSRDHPFEAAPQQDRRILHSSHEEDPEGTRPRDLPQAPGGGARAPHGLRPRRVRH